jgi:predicted outer membrane repeat protein
MALERTLRTFQSVVLPLLLVSAPAWAGICRVTTGGSGFNDGSSWAVPTTLTQALSASGVCTEVWVKKGLYKPATGSDVDISFAIADGVAVYGGFAGSETARAQRDPAANLTVLSGDIDNNDSTDADGVDADPSHIVGNNSKHVVSMTGAASTTVLDGFTVTGGFANLDVGGGLSCSCSAKLSKLVFSGNYGSDAGGVFIHDGSPTLSDIVFTHNEATNSGGALASSTAAGATSSISLWDVTFRNNKGGRGGAMHTEAYASSTATLGLNGVTFSDNLAFDGGGGLYIYAADGADNATLANVTFSGNEAYGGGGAIFIESKFGYSSAGNADATLTNVTFSANWAHDGFGGAIFSKTDATSSGHPKLRNVILWGDVALLGQGSEIAHDGAGATATIDHSIVKGGGGGGGGWNASLGTDGGGNLDVDPRLGALAANHGSTSTMLPGPASPAIDAGNGTGCPSYDQRGIVRPHDAGCDIGAVETFVVDLIGHKGTEACWSKAVTKSSFLGLVGSNVEGNTACIPPFPVTWFNGTTLGSYTMCYTAACPGGTLGCPIKTHTSAFGAGDSFEGGAFSATGTADDIALPGAGATGTCNVTASAITTSYLSDYVFTDDGNHGDYAALLNQFTAAPTNVVLAPSGGSDPNCGVAVSYMYPYFYGAAITAMSSGLKQKLENPTVGQSVCPATP